MSKLAPCRCGTGHLHTVGEHPDVMAARGQVREHHAPADVDLTALRSPGGQPWANTDRILAASTGAAERRRLLEHHVREDQRDQDALRIEAWAAGLTDERERLIAAAAAEVVRGRR